MKAIQFKVLVAAAVLGFSGCDPKSKEDLKGKLNPDLLSFSSEVSEKSTPAELLESTEQMLTPYTFMVAHKIAAMAVKKDPTNIKAQFYSIFLKRFEAFRGIATRIRPLLTAEQTEQLNKEMAAYPPSQMKNFLTEEGPELKTEADIQQMIADYFAAVGELRKFTRDHENEEMVVNFNPFIFQLPFQKELAANFEITDSNGTIKIKALKTVTDAKKLNTADFLVLRQIAAGELLHGLLTYSYDFSGAIKISRQKFSNKEEIMNALFATPEFGKLKKNHGFSELLSLGSDYSAAISWYLKNQEQVCPGGKANRPGNLFPEDAFVCIYNTDKVSRVLALLDSALHGVIELDSKRLKAKVKVDPFAYGRAPLADLRSVAPKFDAHNCVNGFADNTLGGVFVENNASAVLLSPCAP